MNVLRVLTRPNVGGPTRQCVLLWHAHRRQGHRTLLAVGHCETRHEAAVDLEAAGLPRIDPAEVTPASEGFVVVPGLGRAVGLTRELRAVRVLRALIRRQRPDVVHTHTTKAGWLGRWAAHRERVGRVQHTFHGLVLQDYYPRPVGWALARIECWLARRTDALFAVSASCADEVATFGVAERARVTVVPPAVDVERFRGAERASARTRLGLDPDEFVVGFVGRLAPVKRVGAFVDLVRAARDVRGLVFGDGPERSLVEARLGVDSRLIWRGTVDALELELPAIDVLVMPSRREGFPVAGVEAAACGVPTVGADVPGVRDLVAATVELGSRVVAVDADPATWIAAIRSAAAMRSARVPRLLEAVRPDDVAERILPQHGRDVGRSGAAASGYARA